MMRTNGRSQAIFGGLLWGDQPVRYVFMDEAGTSALEPVTVVVGLIASADEHVLAAEALALEAIGSVPPAHQDGFVYHATEVFGGKKYRDSWSMADRLRLLELMMSVPRKIGMAICVSAQWRNAVDHSQQAASLNLSGSQFEHLMAFSKCVAVCDRNIRRHAEPREVATIVAEDIPEMRRFLQSSIKTLRDKPIYLSPEDLRETIRDKEAGYSLQSGEFRVSRIRNSIHFVGKSEDPLIQVADACAYGFRRFFAGEKFGADFVRSIVGDENVLRNFASPGGVECYWPRSSSTVPS
ncbi:MAG: DUF3800 domain-containing protein [Janthinobacterium lividum]